MPFRLFMVAVASILTLPAAASAQTTGDYYSARVLPPAADCIASAKSAHYAAGLHWTAGALRQSEQETTIVGRRGPLQLIAYCPVSGSGTLIATQIGGDPATMTDTVRRFAAAFSAPVNEAVEGANVALAAGERTTSLSGAPAFLGNASLCAEEAPSYFEKAGYVYHGAIGRRLHTGMSPGDRQFVVVDCLPFITDDGKERIRVRFHSADRSDSVGMEELRENFFAQMPLRLHVWDEPYFSFSTQEGHVACTGANLSGRWEVEPRMSCFGREGYVWGAQGRGEGFMCDLEQGCRGAWEDYVDWTDTSDRLPSGTGGFLSTREDAPIRCVVHPYNVNCYIRSEGRIVSAEDFGFRLVSER